MKTRNQLNSSRRSFRTRPSVQFPVILVDNHHVKLFGDDSFDDDFALRSPATRKPTKKKEEPPKVFTNITNRPAIAEEFNEENEQEKLNEELNAAADFSLYIENEDGERMKAVGNKLVKYDEFYGIKPSESNSRKKSFEESLSVKKYNQSDEYTKKLCKAICAAAGVRSKKSSGPFTTPSVSVGPAKERLSHMRPLSRASKAPDPIEELPESDSVETLQVDTSNKENEEDTGAMATMDFATTPKGRPSASEARERSFMTVVAENDDLAGSSVRPHSLRNLPASPIPDLEHMQEPECLRTPLLNTVPQAQSTPLSERFEYPNSNRAALNQVSRRESFDVSDCDMPAIPSTSMARSKGTEPDSPCGDELQTSSDDSRLADAFDSSLQLAPRHDNSCGSVDTLAEVRTELSNAGRNASSMTMNTTYRNISCLRNSSFIDIPYYLHGCADFNTSTPLSQLLFVIGQPRVIEWQNLPKDVFCGPRKLGEGVYGEVFATTYNGEPTALKVIPFQGDTIVYKEKVNGEYLLDATSILPEVLINRELSALFDPSADFSTPNFIKLLHTHVVKGLYPEEFMKAWNEFDEANGSENDPPSNYASEQQLFVAMGMAMGGVDLEHYQMKNEDQVVSVLLQVALSLVVAEERLQFEHRDLHIGNALVLESNDDVEYRYGGGDMVLRSYGLKVHLIDFTLSRLSKEGTTIFRDLESDEELFAGSGDYQFDIYRMMRHSNEGDWLAFNPKSNCFWMHYLAVQLISKRKCKKAIPKKRQRELQKMWDNLLRFESVKELFTHDDFYDILQRHLIIKPQSIQIE